VDSGIDSIARERERQVSAEGWTPEHDDEHSNFELSQAAISYANMFAGGLYSNGPGNPPDTWPWEAEYWKPSPDPIKNLVRAGALIAAEIDRLRRKAKEATRG